MPRKLEIDALQAEEATVRALLEESRSIDDPVGAFQYEQRLSEIIENLEQLRSSHVAVASVALFFSGKPVLGSAGIASDFAGKALRDYQEIIAKQFAKSELGGMGERGRIPLKQDATLMVTGVAHGSFGFVLNELSDQTELHNTLLKEAVTETSSLLESVSAENETSFEQASEDLDTRTLVALQRFFNDLDTEEATIRIVDDERELKLDKAAIHRARVRTEATQITESPVVVEGILTGLLPIRHCFELQGVDGKSYSGSITDEATGIIQQAVDSGRPVLGERCKVGLVIRVVRALNKEREVYRLTQIYSLSDNIASLT